MKYYIFENIGRGRILFRNFSAINSKIPFEANPFRAVILFQNYYCNLNCHSIILYSKIMFNNRKL